MSFSEPDLDNGYFDTALAVFDRGARCASSVQPMTGWNMWASGTGGYEWQPGRSQAHLVGGTHDLLCGQQPASSSTRSIRHQNSADTGGSIAFSRTTLSGGFEYRW